MNSRFWKYFHDSLKWLPIHRPGPLSAIVRGLARQLDEAREDILWLRRQWHPALCEPGAIPGYGRSRRLARHGRESEEQFKKRVINAWAWHMLGGKVEGLPQILRFYGFDIGEIVNMRDFSPNRWAEFQLGLKTPATQAEQAEILANLDVLIWLVNEYKPARSVLFRIYTDTYNIEPLVWSHGSWSNFFWSYFSGVDYPDADNPQGSENVIVSFGMAHRARAEAWAASDLAGLFWLEEARPGRIYFSDYLIWSQFSWSDIPLPWHGFVNGQIFSTHAAGLISDSGQWAQESWPQMPWLGHWRWDRRYPDWSFQRREIPKSMLVWSDDSDKTELAPRKASSPWQPGPWPLEAWLSFPDRDDPAGWSGLNSCWSAPYIEIPAPLPAWSDFFWCDALPRARYIQIDELFQEDRAGAARALNPRAAEAVCAAASLACLRLEEAAPKWGAFVWSGGASGSGRMESRLAGGSGKMELAGKAWPKSAWPNEKWFEKVRFRQERDAPRCAPHENIWDSGPWPRYAWSV